jgi:hypothetical protein
MEKVEEPQYRGVTITKGTDLERHFRFTPEMSLPVSIQKNMPGNHQTVIFSYSTAQVTTSSMTASRMASISLPESWMTRAVESLLVRVEMSLTVLSINFI